MTLAEHVAALAATFKTHVVEAGAIEGSGAGYPVVCCPQCGQHNRIIRTGFLRCGKCRTDFGPCEHARVVFIAAVTSEFTYAVALHELGHCLAPNGMIEDTEFSRTYRRTRVAGTIRDLALILEQERAAWTWARAHALRWSAEMDAAERIGLDSYNAATRRITGRSL